VIKFAAAISILLGIIVGFVANDVVLGASAAGSAFGLGLLMIIALAVQELLPTLKQPVVVEDADLFEDFDEPDPADFDLSAPNAGRQR
jgi:hypothetical protein